MSPTYASFSLLVLDIALENDQIKTLALTHHCALHYGRRHGLWTPNEAFFHQSPKLESQICHFLTPPHYSNSQNSIISFGYVDSQEKIFQSTALCDNICQTKSLAGHLAKLVDIYLEMGSSCICKATSFTPSQLSPLYALCLSLFYSYVFVIKFHIFEPFFQFL